MNILVRGSARTALVSVRALLILTMILGIGYTLLVTGAARILAPDRADGSRLYAADGSLVGSSLIGQSFTDAEGAPLPGYFQPRPSAAGDGYDGAASAGTNAGPENQDLIDAISERRALIAALNDVDPEAVPADAVTASGSGLDPHISPAYADLQIERVARERNASPDDIRDLVENHTRGRDLGFIGEPTVDVVSLNLALDQQLSAASQSEHPGG
ncbi:potassium-transporting ATPase subunit KdpC [Millisia brevis]|uniref:potassium-transporting ATPase subunit KdpC n=1 Tax=Millisia brevis TaxID=264148 RepID=UPI000830F0F9|nr:potassium-transporting ATPase subunit KdpC [Millisia brevis]